MGDGRGVDEERIGRRDLTRWETAAGRRLVRAVVRLLGWAAPRWALLLTLAVGGAVVTAMTAVAAEVYDAVTEGDGVAALDRPVLRWAVGHRPPDVAHAVTLFTDVGGPVLMPVLATVVTVALARLWRSWTPLLLMVPAVAGSLAMTVAGKAVVGRTRPPLVDAVPPYETSASFPSGHSLNAVVIAGVVAYLVLRRLESVRAMAVTVALAGTFAVAMGLSRVYLGHHWLTDVLVAWALGAAWLAVVVTAHRLHLTVRRPAAAAAVVGAGSARERGGAPGA